MEDKSWPQLKKRAIRITAAGSGVRVAPGTVEWFCRKAFRPHRPGWRRRQHGVRVGDLDQLLHRGRWGRDGALEESQEQQAAGTRVPAVEPEGELVDSFGVARERPVQRARCPLAT